MIYPDSVPVDAFSGSVKSLLRFILIRYPVKDYSRPLLVQFKSTNIYPDSVPVDAFSGSVKSLLRFMLICYLVKDYFKTYAGSV